jgi:ABC-type dipeptide/oligopeptide/nickel transport system permease component
VVAAPVITVIGSSFGALLGGAVLTETVFSWPGIGRYLVDSLLGRDVFVLENVLLLVILLVVVVVFLSELISFLVNPQATRGSRIEVKGGGG